jgi:hypothetical protein
MTRIAGIEIQSLRGKQGHLIIRSRIILDDAIVGEAKYPLKQVEELKEYTSADKEIAKIEGRLHSLLKDLPVSDIQTVEAVLDDVFSKSNLDFRFPVALSLVNALAEERATDSSVLLGGEFLTSVPLPIVDVGQLKGPFEARLGLLSSRPLEDRWFLHPPLPPETSFALDQPQALAEALDEVLDRHGLLVDLRDIEIDGGLFAFFNQVSDRLYFLMQPDQLATLGKRSPPNMSEILDHSLLHLDLDDLAAFKEHLWPILPVNALVLTIPASHSLTRVVSEVQQLDDEGFKLVLDSRDDTYGSLGLFALARGLRFRQLWISSPLDASLGVVNKANTLGRKSRSMVYRPIIEPR